MANTKSKLTLSVDTGLIERLHAFVNENPGHPSISAMFEQTMVAYVDYFAPVLERARSGDARASIALLESSMFRTLTASNQMVSDVVKLRADLEVQEKKNIAKPARKTKKKSV
jgi:hypothetical protein